MHGKTILYWSGIAALLVFFFFIYSTLSFQSYRNGIPLFNSPDETANYFFSKLFAEKGTLTFHEPLLSASSGYLHPRSMTAVGDDVAPVSFLGLPVIYGFLAKVFGVNAIPFFTPAIASISALFFFLLVRNVWSMQAALPAMILFLLHPAYLYNANRAMLHNVLFVDLLIIGCALASQMVRMRKSAGALCMAFLAGIALGGSLWVRFSESIWILGLLPVLGIAFYRKLRIGIVAAFLAGLAVPLILMAQYNALVYGNPLLFGYQTPVIPQAVQQIEQSASIIQSLMHLDGAAAKTQIVALLVSLKSALLPFGINPHLFKKTFLDYAVFFFLPFSILAAGGLFFFFWRGVVQIVRERSASRLFLLASYAAMGAWLIVFYGSWVFHDNLDKEVTIGTSYIRYWLPITIYSLPMVGELIAFLLERCRGHVHRAFLAACIVCLALLSFGQVFTGSTESITAMASSLASYHGKRQFIADTTPQDSVLFSARSDKIFFPTRRVAEQTSDFRELELVKGMYGRAPIYYYGLWSQQDASTVSKKYFEPYGFSLVFVADADSREHLYKVTEKQ